MPSTFASTSVGKTTDIWSATGSQQVAAARELIESGQGSAWRGYGC
jgi:hypothetical protein